MNTQVLLISENLAQSQPFIIDLKEHDIHLDTLDFNTSMADIQAKVQRYTLILFDMHQQHHRMLNLLAKLRDLQNLYFLVLSPSEQEQDCLDAFTAGADDYLKKPFILAECIARIKALLRRSHQTPLDDAILVHGDLIVNCLTRQAALADAPLNLTNSQFNILELFLRYPGRVFSKEQLTEYSLGRKYTAYDRSIDVHVSNLRHKLSADHHDESWIETIRGYGYAFTAKG